MLLAQRTYPMKKLSLARTLAITQVSITMFSLVALSMPVAAFAEPVTDTQPNSDKIEICHKGQILSVDANGWNGHAHHPSDFIIHDKNDSEKCTAEAGDTNGTLHIIKQIVGNQTAHPQDFSFTINNGSAIAFESDGQNDITESSESNYTVAEATTSTYTTTYTSSVEGHSNDCTNLPMVNDADVTCTIVNTYQAPVAHSCTLVSDATTYVGSVPAVPSFVHPAWTTGLNSSGAKWIWNAFHATPSDTVDEVVTFTKTFNVVGSPSAVTLDLASDNSYTVDVNGSAACANGADLDNFTNVEPSCNITSLVHTGINTVTFTVTNTHGYGTNPEVNPGGLIYKISIADASCGIVPPPNTAHVLASKVICTDEADLPNWGAGGPDITATTAADWVASHKGCHLADWNFQWAPSSTSNPGDNATGTPSGWTSFMSGINTLIPSGALIWVREQINSAYIGFTGVNQDQNISAEVYCSNDVLNYDNYDFINPVDAGGTYYCVAFNTPKPATILAQKVICTDEADLPNWGAGGPDITATTAVDWVASHKSCRLADWNFQWAPSDTSNPGDNATGTPSGWTSFASGVATTIPAGALAWVRENINTNYIPFVGSGNQSNVSAEMYCNNDVINYDNYDFINPVDVGTTYYCVGFNSPKSSTEPTNTNETIVVKSADLETQALPAAALTPSGKWFFYNDTTDVIDNTLGQFVTGPLVAPIGTGSTDMTLAAANSRTNIATYAFSNTKLSDITSLAFSSYSHSGVAGASESPYLVFNVSFNGTGAYQKRLVYVPANNGAVPQDAWNTNDTIQGGAGKWVYSGTTWPGGVIPGTTPKTWTQILADYPSAKVLPVGGLMGVRVGEPGPAGYEGNVDKFVIGIKTGLNTDTRTYDFEPTSKTGTLKLVKHTIGGNDTFTFSVTGQDPITVTTTENQGLSSNLVLTAGVYDVSEVAKAGWTFNSVLCSDSSEGSLTQTDITAGKHLTLPAGHTVTCYFDNTKGTSDTPPVITQSSARSGSTSRGGTSGGGGGGNGPKILGASTTAADTCIPPITTYMKFSWKNESQQVMALQSFLNSYMHTTLTVNGIFGKATFAAVKAFQKKEGQDVLKPWVGLPGSGIKSKDSPTGYVYQTTKWRINNIVCPGSEEFPTVLQ